MLIRIPIRLRTLQTHHSEHRFLGRLLQLSRNDEFVQNLSEVACQRHRRYREFRTYGVSLLEVENPACMVSVSLYHHKERSAHKSSSQTYEGVSAYNKSEDLGAATHIPKVPVQHLNVTMDNLQHHQLVVALTDSGYEEQRRISPVHNLRVCAARPGCLSESCPSFSYMTAYSAPLYSRKLHMRVRRASTSWVTSFTIFALAF